MDQEFDISEVQVEQGAQFQMKKLVVNVTISKDEVQVFNKGENAAFKLIDSRMKTGFSTMGAHMSIATFLNGQSANYTRNINGLPEALQNGAGGVPSWDGNTYANYGGLTRGGTIGNALNSTPVNVAGSIEVTTLEEAYASCSFGISREPTHLVTTYLGKSFIREKYFGQQRFDTPDPVTGLMGLRINAASILPDNYAPGQVVAGTADPNAVEFFTWMSGGALTSYPSVVGETIWMLNVRKPYLNCYISDDPEFQFGFSGWKPAQGNSRLAGQISLWYALTAAPRYHKQLYAVTG
jgi:hypothetical protein